MFIRRLQVSAFLNHSKRELVFNNGLTLILGRNGIGKTALLDAISVALYDLCARGNKSSLIQSGKTGWEIRLETDFGTIEKQFGSKNRNRLYSATGLIASSVTKITNFVERNFLRAELFKHIIFAEQGRIAGLLQEAPARRMDTFDELLGLKFIDGVYAELTSAKTMLEQAKEGSLSISLAKELSAELSRCRTEREKANEEYRLVRAEANSIDSQYRSLFASRGSVLKELEVSKKRLDSIVQAQEVLKQSPINTEQISDIENKLRELEGLLLTAQAKNRLYTLAIEHTVDTCLLCGQTVERGLLLQRLQKMLKEEASVSAKLQKDLSSLKQLEGELRSLEKKQAQASALYPERIELSEKLPQLELELINLNTQIGKLELQRNRASSSADELHSTLLALERKIAELQAKLSSGYDPERLDKLYAQVSEGADFFSRKKLGALIRSRELSYLDLYLKHFASMFGYEDSCKLDNEVSLWYGDIEFPYLSGGMKVALGLAFRLAMMQVFAVNTRILILDEPTVFLDENRVYTLVDLLMRAKEFIPQIIVVSHNPALKEAADSIIEL